LAGLKPGATLLADKAYDSNAIRDQAQEQDVWANIPPKSNRKGSFVFSTFVYRYRNLVERYFNKLKQFRGIATRYDKNPDNFLAAIKLVSARIWIRSPAEWRHRWPHGSSRDQHPCSGCVDHL
jgi:transposase